MPCNITAPTLNSCNDLKGGVAKVEIAPWSAGFDSGTASWTEIPIGMNAAYGKDTPTTSAENNTTSFNHEVYFKINGIDNFAGWEDMVQARIVARLTTHTGSTLVYGEYKGLSYSGGERNTGTALEDLVGSTLTYAGVSPNAPKFTAAP